MPSQLHGSSLHALLLAVAVVCCATQAVTVCSAALADQKDGDDYDQQINGSSDWTFDVQSPKTTCEHITGFDIDYATGKFFALSTNTILYGSGSSSSSTDDEGNKNDNQISSWSRVVYGQSMANAYPPISSAFFLNGKFYFSAGATLFSQSSFSQGSPAEVVHVFPQSLISSLGPIRSDGVKTLLTVSNYTLIRSTDGGQTWDTAYAGPMYSRFIILRHPVPGDSLTQWEVLFTQDVGNQQLYLTSKDAFDWNIVNTTRVFPDSDFPGCAAQYRAHCVAFSIVRPRNDPNSLVAACATEYDFCGTQVYKSSDNGKTWKNVSPFGTYNSIAEKDPLPAWQATNLIQDEKTGNLFLTATYMVLHTWDTVKFSTVFLSTDSGQSFVPLVNYTAPCNQWDPNLHGSLCSGYQPENAVVAYNNRVLIAGELGWIAAFDVSRGSGQSGIKLVSGTDYCLPLWDVLTVNGRLLACGQQVIDISATEPKVLLNTLYWKNGDFSSGYQTCRHMHFNETSQTLFVYTDSYYVWYSSDPQLKAWNVSAVQLKTGPWTCGWQYDVTSVRRVLVMNDKMYAGAQCYNMWGNPVTAIISSSDGIVWTLLNDDPQYIPEGFLLDIAGKGKPGDPESEAVLLGVAYGASDSNPLFYTTDAGNTWSSDQFPQSEQPFVCPGPVSVTYSEHDDMFYAAGQGECNADYGFVWRSPSTVPFDWSLVSTIKGQSLSDIASVPSTGDLITVGENGYVAWSADGENWPGQNIPALLQSDLHQVYWAAHAELVVVVGEKGAYAYGKKQ